MPSRRNHIAIALTLAGGCVVGVWAMTSSRAEVISGEEALHPQQHFSVERPGELDKTEAIRTYNEIVATMARRYAVPGEPTTRAYRTWRRYNDAPYRSETHGNRYVNNYANAIAATAGYGAPAPGIQMPRGAILAKDSFTYTADQEVFPGALFIMEKLSAGRSPATADWRYVMILPDGTTFGDSADDPSGTMTFCHECHEQRADFDHLFFVPEAYRAWPTAD